MNLSVRPRLCQSVAVVALALGAASLTSCNATAQDFDFGGDQKQHVTVTASYEPGAQAGRGTLVVNAAIDKGWHIYSTSQKRGGPVATKVKLDESAKYKQAGPIVYAPKPTIKKYDFWPKLDVEEHYGKVTWRIPIELPSGGKPTITGVVDLQMCDANRCLPKKIPFSTASR